ncbi:MAG: SUMF1/EgtB/PvdO family nonheme iron enzyme [Candidatus Latescibacterota bacterium]
MDEWWWWLLTCGFGLYFVILLLEFNRPSQKLQEQIDNQEQRRVDMAQRLDSARKQIADIEARQVQLESEMEAMEQKRQESLPEANKRLMIHIPNGPFTMGGRDEEYPRGERPAHSVFLTDYYIARYPTTNQDYREFIQCTGHRVPIHWQRGTFPTGMAQHPVVNVSWQDAAAFAAWRGARLPTEAEWEKAARGEDERPYPWGPRFTEGERCNGGGAVGMTTPVDEYPEGRSEYGVWDLCGNVYEWCNDFYDEEYYKNSPSTNPKGPEGGQERVVRGGSYMENRAGLRATHRDGVTEVTTRDTIGFRIAMNADGTVSG